MAKNQHLAYSTLTAHVAIAHMFCKCVKKYKYAQIQELGNFSQKHVLPER